MGRFVLLAAALAAAQPAPSKRKAPGDCYGRTERDNFRNSARLALLGRTVSSGRRRSVFRSSSYTSQRSFPSDEVDDVAVLEKTRRGQLAV